MNDLTEDVKQIIRKYTPALKEIVEHDTKYQNDVSNGTNTFIKKKTVILHTLIKLQETKLTQVNMKNDIIRI